MRNHVGWVVPLFLALLLIFSSNTEVIAGDIPITTAVGSQTNVSVIPNGSNFFVTWVDSSGGTTKLLGSRVTALGEILDPNGILITNSPPSAIASSGSSFVIADGGTLIRWERYSYEGQLLESDYILPSASLADPPEIACNNSGKCLIVWVPIGDLNVQGVIIPGGNSFGFPISTYSTSRQSAYPRVVSNGTDFFVTWTMFTFPGDGSGDLYGTRVLSNGTVAKLNGNKIAGASFKITYPDGSSITLGVQEDNSKLSFDGTNYLSVWDAQSLTRDTYAARIRASDGALIDLTGVRLLPSQEISGVGFDGTNYFIVWGTGSVYGARVTRTLTVLDPAGIQLSANLAKKYGSRVACKNIGQCLVTWVDERNLATSGTDIFGTIAGSLVRSLSGKVSQNGIGLEGVTMVLSGYASTTTTTVAGGTYNITGVVDGTYTITPNKTDYLFDPNSRSVTVAGTDKIGQDFSAIPCKSLSGTLRDGITKRPLHDVSIVVDNGVYSAKSAVDGSYTFVCIPLGKQIVKVLAPPGYTNSSRTVDVSQTSTHNIDLTKEQTVNGTNTNSGYSKDPVNTATGNYTYQRSDIDIPGIGIPFAFERAYNSREPQNGPLRFGWSHSYNAALTVNPDATVTIRWDDGKTETWTPDGSGGFTPQYGVFDSLIDNGDGTYTLKKKDLIRFNFNSAGRLASIVDKNGNSISLAYTGANLTQISDTAGRVITFTYDANNRITLITDPIPRTIQFTYDASGDLVSATDMNGNPTLYTYDTNHQLLTAKDPRGNTFVTNIYDDAKRVVVSQKDAKLGVTLYLYDEVDRKTTIIDQLSNPTIHYHDELLRLIQQ